MGYLNATLVRSPIYEVFRAESEENLGEERAELRAVYRVVRRGFFCPTLMLGALLKFFFVGLDAINFICLYKVSRLF